MGCQCSNENLDEISYSQGKSTKISQYLTFKDPNRDNFRKTKVKNHLNTYEKEFREEYPEIFLRSPNKAAKETEKQTRDNNKPSTKFERKLEQEGQRQLEISIMEPTHLTGDPNAEEYQKLKGFEEFKIEGKRVSQRRIELAGSEVLTAARELEININHIILNQKFRYKVRALKFATEKMGYVIFEDKKELDRFELSEEIDLKKTPSKSLKSRKKKFDFSESTLRKNQNQAANGPRGSPANISRNPSSHLLQVPSSVQQGVESLENTGSLGGQAPKLVCKQLLGNIEYVAIEYCPRNNTLYAYDMNTGNIDAIHDSSSNVNTQFISGTPHKPFESIYPVFLKKSYCNKFLFILRTNYVRGALNFYIDIRGVGDKMKGFSSSVLGVLDIADEMIARVEAKKGLNEPRARSEYIADFNFIGNQEVTVLSDRGVLSLWKFQRLEVAEDIEVQVIPLEENEICYK